jgi:hypothetical protein
MFFALLSATVASASTIPFDPDGPGGNPTYAISSFDFLPGNAIFRNLGDIVTPRNGQTTTHYLQATLGNLLGPNNEAINPPGMNSVFQLNVVFGFDAVANVHANGSFLNTSYALAANPTTAYFKIYYNDTPANFADDLAGTGFDVGQVILSGTVSSASGVFSRLNSGTTLFDEFGADNYSGLQTYRVSGGASLVIDNVLTNNAFFPLVTSHVNVTLFNNSDVTPFDGVNPSGLFQANAAAFVPNLGGLNGAGPDFQLQSDSNSSFEVVPNQYVPEPSSFVLSIIGLGLFWVVGVRPRRPSQMTA